MNSHADLLKALLPPVSYDLAGPAIAAQLEAEGAALDDALAASLRVLSAITPDGDTGLLPDWERVRKETLESPYARAFLLLLEMLDLLPVGLAAGARVEGG